MKPDRLVIDASVAAAVVLEEESAAQAASYFAKAQQGTHQLMAPWTFRIECSNACWKRAQRRRLTAAEARAAADHFERLPVVLIDVAGLASAAVDLALYFGVSVYDAMYVATAEYAGTSLVTRDRKLAFALRERGWKSPVILLR